jgi:predicted MFS family arabinose efflux permease
VAINFSMGVLYGWSLFLAALEHEIDVDRSTISLAPSLALAFFTVGVLLHDRGLRLLPLRTFTLLSCGLAAAGHLLYAAIPSVTTLLIGYGVLFGTAAGLIYGIALFVASSSGADPRRRGIAIGFATSAFALTGLVLSLIGQHLFEGLTARQDFVIIGIFQLAIGVLAFWLIPDGRSIPLKRGDRQNGVGGRRLEVSLFSVGLITSFLFVCFVGLMTVSHSAAILSDRGASPSFALLAPLLVSVGYIVGGILGGVWAAATSIVWSLLMVCGAAVIGAALLLICHADAAMAISLALLGWSLGSAAAVYPAVVGRRYGAENIGAIYGKILIGYGVSGLVAPWLTGFLYVSTGSYQVPIGIALALGLASVASVLLMARKQAG